MLTSVAPWGVAGIHAVLKLKATGASGAFDELCTRKSSLINPVSAILLSHSDSELLPPLFTDCFST